MAITAEGGYDIPSGLPRSPLFGAKPFTQKLILFEEFGTLPVPTTPCTTCTLLPQPETCTTFPASDRLDEFLNQPLNPLPTALANTTLPNSWSPLISQCLKRPVRGNIEGRPPGPDFAHQRYNEFAPKAYFQTAQTGSRANSGLRDRFQRHGYSIGEFAPGGLYHNTAGTPVTAGTTKGIQARLHPNMPVQAPHSIWTFDGTFPPKLLMARYGEPVLLRHYNALPVDGAANNGFGNHTITTHEHNGHHPAESDGFTSAYFYPGAFYDYNWPMILAGYDSINTTATNPRAGMPNGAGGNTPIRGDWRETMSTHWFHDHMFSYTAQNVYKGNVAMSNFYSAVDRGREPRTVIEAQGSVANPGYGCHYSNPNNVNLCLPSGSGVDWGNRDYDVNLLISDKATDSNGQLAFNPFSEDGFLGDLITVNFLYKPTLEVRARKYRFRLLNGSVARYLKIALVDQKGVRVPHHLIANDGNLMEHAVPFPNAQSLDLPSQGIGERYDIIIDFSKFKEGDKLYFVNLLAHDDGRGPKEIISLANALTMNGVNDPGVGKFLEFQVKAYTGTDLSMNPADYVEGKKKMIPLPGFTSTELANAKHRTFEFGRSSGTDNEPWTIKTDNGPGLVADPHRVSAAATRGSVEIWRIENSSGGWTHPVHVHFEEGQIIRRGDKAPPLWEKWARKDLFRVGPIADSTESVEVAYRFREFMGTYMEHCHNTQHEDHAMLLRWDIENPGQLIPFLTPIPTYDGVTYEKSFTLPTAKTGDGVGVNRSRSARVSAKNKSRLPASIKKANASNAKGAKNEK